MRGRAFLWLVYIGKSRYSFSVRERGRKEGREGEERRRNPSMDTCDFLDGEKRGMGGGRG